MQNPDGVPPRRSFLPLIEQPAISPKQTSKTGEAAHFVEMKVQEGGG